MPPVDPQARDKVPNIKTPPDNVVAEVQVENGVQQLVVGVDLSKDFGRTSKGRADIVANTHGFTSLPGHPAFYYSLLVIRRLPERMEKAARRARRRQINAMIEAEEAKKRG